MAWQAIPRSVDVTSSGARVVVEISHTDPGITQTFVRELSLQSSTLKP